MKRLNYTLVIVSTKEVKNVLSGLWFDDKTSVERYAEGISVGFKLAGKKNYAVVMHIKDDPEMKINRGIGITKTFGNMQQSIYYRDYIWKLDKTA